jgi:hypothetical protein
MGRSWNVLYLELPSHVAVGKACSRAAKTSPISVSFQDLGGYMMQSTILRFIETRLSRGRRNSGCVTLSKKPYYLLTRSLTHR